MWPANKGKGMPKTHLTTKAQIANAIRRAALSQDDGLWLVGVWEDHQGLMVGIEQAIIFADDPAARVEDCHLAVVRHGPKMDAEVAAIAAEVGIPLNDDHPGSEWAEYAHDWHRPT